MKRRTTGCSCPWNWEQILVLLLFIVEYVLFYLFVVPIFAQPASGIISIIYVFISLTVFLFGARLMFSDPTQSIIRVKYDKKYRFNPQTILKMSNLQISKYCDICQSDVQFKTKHCRKCNRCCQGFDHHCRMVNNCVGWNNYSDFIVLIISSFILASFKLILQIVKVIMFALNKKHIKWVYFTSIKMDITNSIILLSVLAFIDFVLYVYFLKLIITHIYLYKKGITMYQHIKKPQTQQEIMPIQIPTDSVR